MRTRILYEVSEDRWPGDSLGFHPRVVCFRRQHGDRSDAGRAWAGNGSKQRSDEIPMKLLAIGLQILHTEFAFAFNLFRVPRRAFASHAIKPSHRCVVVV